MTDFPSSIPPEELLAQTSFLRALARELLRDEHASEDVVQTTWLEALERRGGPLVNPRAWMARVARNLALDRRRADRRRETREQDAAQTEALPSVADTLAHETTLRAVTDAVLGLDEPYRATILLRYFEGLELREIAARLAEPLATVRSRHARALARLRERLDRSHGGERGAWAVGLARLIGGGRASLAGAGAKAEIGASVTARALIMTSKWKLAALVLLVLLGSFGLWLAVSGGPDRDAVVAAPLVAPLESEAARAPAEQATPSSAAASVASERARVEPASRALSGSLRVHVAWSDGQPAAGVSVGVVPWGSAHVDLEQTFSLTDAHGDFRLVHVAPGDVGLFVDRGGGYQRVAVSAGGETSAELVIQDGVDVRGLVVDLAGRPVPEAEIWITSPVNTSEGIPVERSDASGRFFLRSLGYGRQVGARAAAYGPSPEFLLPDRPGETLELRLVLQEQGSALRVLVRDPDGRPVAGARVRLAHDGDGSFARAGYAEEDPLSPGRMCAPSRTKLVCDANGVCEAPCLQPGETGVIVAAVGWAPDHATIELEPRAARTLDIMLERGVSVHGVVRGPDGVPIAGARIMVKGPGDIGACRTESRGDGSYRLENVAAGVIEISAGVERAGRTSETLRAGDGAELEWNPVLDAGRVLRGRMVDERGAGLAGLEVAALVGGRERGAPHSFERRAKTDETGAFRVLDCPENALRLEVRWPEHATLFPVAEFDGLRADGELHELCVLDARLPSAVITGHVHGVDGRPLAAEIEVTGADGWRAGNLLSVGESGFFGSGLLAPGDYSLRVRGQGYEGLYLPSVSVQREQTLDLGVLQLGGAGRLTAELIAVEGVDPSRLDIVLLTGGPEPRRVRDLSPGDLTSGIELPPGSYELLVSGAALLRIPLAITADQVAHLRLEPRRAAQLVFALESERALGEQDEIVFLFRSSDASEAWRTSSSATHVQGQTLAFVSVPAADGYTVEIQGPDGLRGSARVDGARLAPDAQLSLPPLAVQLR